MPQNSCKKVQGKLLSSQQTQLVPVYIDCLAVTEMVLLYSELLQKLKKGVNNHAL